MKVVGTCRVVDVLGEWGTHNTRWRAKREVADAVEGADFTLTYYASFVGRILTAEPVGCVRVEIVRKDLSQLMLYTYDPADSVVKLHHTEERVRAMVATDEQIVGPSPVLVSTSKFHLLGFGSCRLWLVFDGWNRLAARILHGMKGKVYPIVANVILTIRDPRAKS